MLDRVTLTGIDNKTNVSDLVELSKEFPFVEFGILVSKNNTNADIENRYPNIFKIRELKDKNLKLACHLCGSIARNIIQKNDWKGIIEILGDDFDIFQRVQLNVMGVQPFSHEIVFPRGKSFLIQLKNETSLYDFYKDKFYNVFGFQDNSGGRGIFEDYWKIEDRYFGYGGGLSENNVEMVIDKLNLLTYNNYWIDMESSIRTDDWFDIEKCHRVAKICEKYIR